MARCTIYSKLAKRGLTGVVVRERLFVLLDRFRERPLTWIAGPPGAGKTTLVASYLESRALPAVWFVSEAGDADPSVVFRRLGALLPARRTALPVYSDEYRADLGAFCRRFWPQFFARMRSSTILVIDGLTPAIDADFLGVIIHEAIEQAPDHIRVIATSRTQPPVELARPLMQQDIGLLGWNELRFNLAETRAVASDTGGLNEEQLQILHELAAGWAAGLRMLLEHFRHSGQLACRPSTGDQDALFRFLASEVFQRLPVATRIVLLSTSLLPRVTQQAAEALSRDNTAWQVIIELNERRLFIDAMEGSEHVYQYHALFKSFLVAQARKELGATEYRSLQQRTAAFLAARGQAAHAIPLYASAGDWVAAATLILVEATSLLAHGHSQTLRGWVQALPAWYVEATPRLLYCQGLSQCVLEPALARSTLERAYQRFFAERNALGQALVAAAIVQAYYFQFDAFDALDRWIDPASIRRTPGYAAMRASSASTGA